MSEQAEWLTVGAKVAVLRMVGVRLSDQVSFHTVGRMTKTLAVLDDGRKFNRSTLREPGKRGKWSAWCKLVAADDPQAVRVGEHQAISLMVTVARRELDAAITHLRKGEYAAAKDSAVMAVNVIGGLT